MKAETIVYEELGVGGTTMAVTTGNPKCFSRDFPASGLWQRFQPAMMTQFFLYGNHNDISTGRLYLLRFFAVASTMFFGEIPSAVALVVDLTLVLISRELGNYPGVSFNL